MDGKKGFLFFSPIIDFLFFQQCVLCGNPDGPLCRQCVLRLPRSNGKCLACGKKNPFFGYCQSCQKRYQSDKVIAPFAYSRDMKKIIKQMKFNDVSSLCDCFAKEMAEISFRHVNKPVIVPVPLSKNRKKYRGYNQCELLAKSLSKETGWPVVCLLKRRQTELSQVEAKYKAQRKKNIKGVFEILKGEIPDEIILLDDVITTGATVEEACKVLKKVGVKKVIALSLAMGT